MNKVDKSSKFNDAVKQISVAVNPIDEFATNDVLDSTDAPIASTSALLPIMDYDEPIVSAPLSDLCKEGLMMDNIDKILEGCHFSYSKPPIAIRLLDEGILVQGENLTVTEDGRAIYEITPYVIYSDKQVKISKVGQELIFPALVTPSINAIVKSRLTNVNILLMKNKAFWDELSFTFNIHDYIEWIAIFIEGILAPMTLCGICLGLKNRVTQRQQRKIVVIDTASLCSKFLSHVINGASN